MSLPGNTTIELVSEDGPIDFNVMMREGVKALTKILTDHLQDHPDFLEQQSMKLVFKDDGGKIEPLLTDKDDAKSIRNEDMHDDRKDKIGHSDSFIADEETNASSNISPLPSIEVSIGDCSASDSEDDEGREHVDNGSSQSNETELVEGLPESEVEEVLFDYEHRDLSSLPGDIGQDIQKLISSSIHSGASQTTQAVHSVSDLNSSASTKSGKLNKDSNITSEHRHKHDSKRPFHAENCKKSHHHESFNYSHNPKHKPDFGSLAAYDKPLCIFCEYYFVFGEAPKNMIKWYYRTHGKDGPQCPSYAEDQKGHKS